MQQVAKAKQAPLAYKGNKAQQVLVLLALLAVRVKQVQPVYKAKMEQQVLAQQVLLATLTAIYIKISMPTAITSAM